MRGHRCSRKGLVAIIVLALLVVAVLIGVVVYSLRSQQGGRTAGAVAADGKQAQGAIPSPRDRKRHSRPYRIDHDMFQLTKAALSPAGSRVLAAFCAGRGSGKNVTLLALYDQDGTRLWLKRAGTEPIRALYWLPNGRQAVVSPANKAAAIYSIARGEVVRELALPNSTGEVHIEDLSADGRVAVITGDRNGVSFVDVLTGKIRNPLHDPAIFVYHASLSPSANRFLMASALWDIESRQRLWTYGDLFKHNIDRGWFSPDGRKALVSFGGSDWALDGIGLMDLASPTLAWRARWIVNDAAAFTPNGKEVVAVGYRMPTSPTDSVGPAYLVRWEAASGHEVARFQVYHKSVSDCVFSGDSQRCLLILGNSSSLYTDDSPRLQLYDSSSGRLLHERQTHQEKQLGRDKLVQEWGSSLADVQQ